MSTSYPVAFIGLGVMGYPMAGHLVKAGHKVTVYNRNPEKAQKWVAQHGGTSKPTPREAGAGAKFVFSCVGNDNDLRSVALGENGILAGMERDAVYVDHTTASATVARELGDVAKGHGVHMLDGPVSGGQLGAENGQLSVMVGGDAALFQRAKPVIDAYARSVVHMGPLGSGQLTKMVNQICIAGIISGLAEGLNFAMLSGLDIESVLAAVSKGAAQSWQMESRSKTMVAGKFDFGFAVDWMRKDLAICLEEARSSGAQLPITALVDQFYARVQAMGGSRWDTSSLIALLRPPQKK